MSYDRPRYDYKCFGCNVTFSTSKKAPKCYKCSRVLKKGRKSRK